MRFAHWFTLGEGQGGGETSFPNHSQYLAGLIKDLVIPETQNLESSRLQPSITHSVFVTAFSMLPTVQFDNNPAFEANKIHDIWAQRLLSPEFETFDMTSAEIAPQILLGIGDIVSEIARALSCIELRHSFTPTLSLPRQGGGE